MRISALKVLLLCALLPAAAMAAEATDPRQPDAVFARVGDTVITVGDFDEYLRQSIRNKYYHGTVPAPELARFQREVGEEMVNRTLLAAEARRRGIEPDPERIRAVEARYDQRFANHPHWSENRERVLSRVREDVRTDSLVEQLEARVRDVPLPAPEAIRRYYDAHPELFTEPERTRVSVILLKVDPSSPAAAWRAARERATELAAAIRAGADFAELARGQSEDPTAPNGGDMGYLHAGMLGDVAEKAIAALEVGQITDPVTLLEGIALFRLVDRERAQLNAFDNVRERAGQLARRERGEEAWKALLVELRKNARIEVHEEHYLPLAASEAGGS